MEKNFLNTEIVGSTIVLLDNEHSSLEISELDKYIPKTKREKSLSKDGKFIPLKARGKVIGVRKLKDDPEVCYLVKFKGFSGPRHV
ncbi:MAG: hypothetical protein M0R03_16125, partial [Novosphingobium sp.]|nr:hypothetical protein [Novosphingobium sp.]